MSLGKHEAVVTDPHGRVPAPGGHRPPGGGAGVAHALAALAAVVHPPAVLRAGPLAHRAQLRPDVLVTHGARADLAVRHPVVRPEM